MVGRTEEGMGVEGEGGNGAVLTGGEVEKGGGIEVVALTDVG